MTALAERLDTCQIDDILLVDFPRVGPTWVRVSDNIKDPDGDIFCVVVYDDSRYGILSSDVVYVNHINLLGFFEDVIHELALV